MRPEQILSGTSIPRDPLLPSALPPDLPLTEARLEKIQELGGNLFNEDFVPRAVTRFKQGLGHLNRSTTDTGRVVVQDGRIATARYGKRFLDAPPTGMPIVTISPSES